MMDNDQNNCPQGTGPGGRLCQARVGLGLGREEIAQRLHLSLRQVLALESDDYTNLPGPTYVRGYLRAYAHLVGLKSDPILAAYNALADVNKTYNLTSLAPKEEITSQHHQVKFATYAVVAILLGLALAWWQGRENGPEPSPAEPTAGQFTGAIDDGGVARTDVRVTQPVAGDTPVAPITPPAPTSPLQSTATAVHAPSAPKPKPVPPLAATTTRDDGSNGVEPIEANAGVISNEPPSAGPGPESNPDLHPETPNAPTVNANLALYADAESWMDVRDARGNKLLYGTVSAGRKIVLNGVVPLRVFLGNAAGVRAEFNGKPYDVNRHQRGLVARFTLGEELVQPGADAADR